MVTLGGDSVARFSRFSLYNSPYPAHDRGCAVDLYPDGDVAPSPVAGEVTLTRTVRCPSRPYASTHDHLVVVDTGTHLARLLHVDPVIEPGDCVRVGDPLGETVRSGFFAPWVDDHVHLGFRERDANPVRAAGSLSLEVAVDVEPVAWDGRGVVRTVGETDAVLDAPAHPAPGEQFAGVATDDGAVLDGGFPYYDGGGRLDDGETADAEHPSVSLLGTPVGRASGRTVSWEDVTVYANGEPVRGLSLGCARDALGVKLVEPTAPLAVGDEVRVEICRT